MIDLHLHLDGSISPEGIFRMARKQGVALPEGVDSPETLAPHLVCPADCPDLNVYLEKFALPLQVLQTAEGIVDAVEDVVAHLAAEGTLYAEIRFAPQLHCAGGLTQEDVVDIACRAQDQYNGEYGLKTQLIMCCIRGSDNAAANLCTLELAAKYLGRGVCAADLAGAEALFATENFRGLFAPWAEKGLPFTIHAGEADGPESIRAALAMGAKRIGHGVRCVEDPALMKTLAEQQIPLECCPTSNLQTRAISDRWQDYPLRSLLQAGLAVTVNSDNRTVSSTTAGREFAVLEAKLGLTPEEKRKLLCSAARAAFLPVEEKELLERAVLARLG